MESRFEASGTAPRLDLLAGRVLIASLFLVAGIRKVTDWSSTSAGFASLGVPKAEFVLPLVVAIELLGGFMLVFGWRLRWVGYVLAAFTLGTGFIGHAFWSADRDQFGNQLNHFLKNLAVCGGLISLVAASRPQRN